MPGFIQITDTHIVQKGQLAYGRSDTATALKRAIATINDRLPLLPGIECAILTGDLTDHGTTEEYGHFLEMMARLDIPWRAIPGNHDQREPMRRAFADQDWSPEEGPIQWSRDFGPFSLIGLDTLLEGAHHGEMSEEGFAYLDQALSQIADQPVVIATHHPWMHSGIRAMDADNLRNGDRLMQRLNAHPGTVRMISGHVHRALTTQIGKITCQIAPSTCHAVHLDHRPDGNSEMALEPGAVSVYAWRERPGPSLVSDILPLGEYPGPWPFAG